MTMNGIDISGYQSLTTLQSWLPKIDFGIVKATEGHTLRLSSHAPRVAVLRVAGKHVAHYHYAWPENGGAADAANFLSFVDAQPGDILALDFEPFHSHAPVSVWPEYVVDFANAVHAKYGVWPVLYCEDYHLSKLMAACTPEQAKFIRDLPLWKAGANNAYIHTSSAPAFRGDLHGWPVVTFWQWTDLPLDRDVFYGDASTWAKLAVPGGAVAAVHESQPTSSRSDARPALPTPAPAPAPASHSTSYTVHSGDTLSAIASRYHVTVAQLVSWNKLSNPNLIYPGQVLHIGSTAAGISHHLPRHYTVVKGDTLGAIAKRFKVTVAALARWNHIANPNLIYPGQSLRVG
jgi:LysM repeat protein